METEATRAFISIRLLEKSYGRKHVLRGVDLEVMTGETMIILGGSGEGKSVLLRHVNGLERPDAWAVWIEGRNLNPLSEEELAPVRSKVAMVFQQGALFDSLTVYENVAYPLRKHDEADEDVIHRHVSEVLAMLELRQAEPLYPAELSGGMRKRVAIARALALAPKAVLFDEPTAGLDPVVGFASCRADLDSPRWSSPTMFGAQFTWATASRCSIRAAFDSSAMRRNCAVRPTRKYVSSSPPQWRGDEPVTKSRFSTFQVGALIAVGIGLFCFSIFYIGYGSRFLQRTGLVQARFRRTNGLLAGAPVALNGVNVGAVSSIRFPEDPDADYVIVTMWVEQRALNRIRSDAAANIRTMGLLGDKYVEITGGHYPGIAARSRQNASHLGADRLRGHLPAT